MPWGADNALVDLVQKVALLHAQRICHMCQEMALETRRQNEPHGTIRLATADSMCAPLISKDFSSFRDRYPNISLKVMTAGTSELFRLLDHNEVDIVCTLDSHIYNTNYVIATEERVGVHFVISSDNPLAKRRSLTMGELLAQPFLLTEKGMSYRRLLDEKLAQKSMEIQPVLEIGRRYHLRIGGKRHGSFFPAGLRSRQREKI